MQKVQSASNRTKTNNRLEILHQELEHVKDALKALKETELAAKVEADEADHLRTRVRELEAELAKLKETR